MPVSLTRRAALLSAASVIGAPAVRAQESLKKLIADQKR
jgi:hypothetical protein